MCLIRVGLFPLASHNHLSSFPKIVWGEDKHFFSLYRQHRNNHQGSVPTCHLGTWCNKKPARISGDLAATSLLITCQIRNRSPWGSKLLTERAGEVGQMWHRLEQALILSVFQRCTGQENFHIPRLLWKMPYLIAKTSRSLFLLTLIGKFSFFPGLGYIGTLIFLLAFSHLGWEKGYKSVKARSHCSPLPNF